MNSLPISLYLKSNYSKYASESLCHKEHVFHTYANLNVFIGSWNVNAKLETIEDLSGWLNIDTYIGESPEIIIIGLQEIIELTATNTLVASSVVTSSNNNGNGSVISSERIIRLFVSMSLAPVIGGGATSLVET